MQMSRMQSSPFQELVLLNILIHRMIINPDWNIVFYTSCWRKTEAMIVPFTMLTINKSRGILEMSVPSHKRVSSKRLEKCLILQPNQPKVDLFETIAVDSNREHGLNSIDTSCDLVITTVLSHIDDIRFWSVLSFSVAGFAEETCLTGNVIACVAGVTTKRGRVRGIRARKEREEGTPARTL